MILSEEVKFLGSQKVLDSTPASRCFVASNDGNGYFVGLVHYKLGCGCTLVRYCYLVGLARNAETILVNALLLASRSSFYASLLVINPRMPTTSVARLSNA